MTSAGTGTTTATVTVESTTAGDTIYCALRTDDVNWTSNHLAELQAGQSTTSAVGTNTFNFTGLNPGTDYVAGAIQTGTGYESNVTNSAFATEAQAGTAPFEINELTAVQTLDTASTTIDLGRSSVGGSEPLTFTFSNLPTGYTYDGNTGIVTVVPTNPVTLTVTRIVSGVSPDLITQFTWLVTALPTIGAVFGDESDKLILDVLLARDLTDRDANLEIGLFTNSTITEQTTLAQITEPSGGGYARQTLTDANWSATNPRTYSPQIAFTATGTYPEAVYGYFVATKSTGAPLACCLQLHGLKVQ